jgi:hypothetical protein
MTQSTPPGWYPDGQGGQRWWDGNQWTEHTLPPETSDRPAAPEQPAQPAASDVTQVRPGGPAGEQPAGDRPAGAEAGQPPASMPTQVARSDGPGQPGGQPGAQQGYPGAQQQGGFGQQPGYPGSPQQGGYPGQPGPPGWEGQQLGGGSGGGVSAKLIGIIAGAAAIVIALAVVLVVVVGGGGGPGGVVEDYFDAIQDQDCDFIDLLSKDARAELEKGTCEDDPEAFFGGDSDTCPDSDIEIKDEKEDGDKATVEFEVTGGGDDCEEKGTIDLVKEDGDWKIASFG